MNTAKPANMFTVTTQTSNNDQNKDYRIYVHIIYIHIYIHTVEAPD